MAAQFDNLEDVHSKFSGTIVIYDGKAARVNSVHKHVDDEGNQTDEFRLSISYYQSRNSKAIPLDDPKLNYKEYSIGYVNGGSIASWWFRKPQRQYYQGLRGSQMGWRTSAPNAMPHSNFDFAKPFVAMLEGNYPSMQECEAMLRAGNMSIIAFHRDFAISYDKIHEDFILEYRGMKVGNSVDHSLKQFKILPEARHLKEAIREACSV